MYRGRFSGYLHVTIIFIASIVNWASKAVNFFFPPSFRFGDDVIRDRYVL